MANVAALFQEVEVTIELGHSRRAAEACRQRRSGGAQIRSMRKPGDPMLQRDEGALALRGAAQLRVRAVTSYRR